MLQRDFSCRVCGAGPRHYTPGTWGGLIPIEYITGIPIGSCAGASSIFFCVPCWELVAAETWSAAREVDTAFAKLCLD